MSRLPKQSDPNAVLVGDSTKPSHAAGFGVLHCLSWLDSYHNAKGNATES